MNEIYHFVASLPWVCSKIDHRGVEIWLEYQTHLAALRIPLLCSYHPCDHAVKRQSIVKKGTMGKWATLQSHINSVERYIQSKKLEILTSLQTPSSHVGLHPIFPQLWGMRQDEVSHSDNLRFQQFRRTSHESQLLSELFNVMNSKVNNTNILWRYFTLYLNVLSSFPVVCVNVPNTRADFSWHVHITRRSN